jgi:hypothetical protein
MNLPYRACIARYDRQAHDMYEQYDHMYGCNNDTYLTGSNYHNMSLHFGTPTTGARVPTRLEEP